jgi:phosphoribosylformylglycinamidine synthase
VYLTPVSKSTILTSSLDRSKAYKIPMAHGEGNFYASADELKRIEDNDQVLFRYCTETGEVTDEANPNGSLNNIAGVANAKKNVFGMMPHPERASDYELDNTDGREILEAALALISA